MVYKTPQLVSCNLINPIKALRVLNRYLEFFPEFFKGFIGWQVQAIEAEKIKRIRYVLLAAYQGCPTVPL